MDGPKDHQTKSSKSERERQTSYGKTYVWNLKKKRDELIFKTETDSMVTKRERWEKDKLGVWD